MDTLTFITISLFALFFFGAVFGFLYVALKKDGGQKIDRSNYWTFMIVLFSLVIFFSIISTI